jgi:hypothetical protein
VGRCKGRANNAEDRSSKHFRTHGNPP